MERESDSLNAAGPVEWLSADVRDDACDSVYSISGDSGLAMYRQTYW